MTKEQAEPNPRRINVGAAQRADVRKALAPIVERVPDWQRETAFLRAMWDRPGATRVDVAPRVERVRESLDDAIAEIDRAVAGLPEGLRTSGYVEDVRKSLAAIGRALPPAIGRKQD